MSKIYGEGIDPAYRQNGVLHIRATGMKPYAQTKVSIEELPFLIYPPQFGSYFESDGIVSPVMLPFDIERAFPHYPSVPTVHIVDKNGGHVINIEEKAAAVSSAAPSSVAQAYVVYKQLGFDHYLIAKSDAIVIAVYQKVFGPDTYESCQAYVAAHTAAPALSVNLVPDTFNAWIDKQPGTGAGPRFYVTVDAIVEVDWVVDLVAASPQGINPLVKLLDVKIRLPDGVAHSNAVAIRTLRYQEIPAGADYTDVTLKNGAHTVSTKVTATS